MANSEDINPPIRGSRRNWRLAHQAALDGRAEIVKAMLKAGLPVTQLTQVRGGFMGKTVLDIAKMRRSPLVAVINQAVSQGEERTAAPPHRSADRLHEEGSDNLGIGFDKRRLGEVLDQPVPKQPLIHAIHAECEQSLDRVEYLLNRGQLDEAQKTIWQSVPMLKPIVEAGEVSAGEVEALVERLEDININLTAVAAVKSGLPKLARLLLLISQAQIDGFEEGQDDLILISCYSTKAFVHHLLHDSNAANKALESAEQVVRALLHLPDIGIFIQPLFGEVILAAASCGDSARALRCLQSVETALDEERQSLEQEASRVAPDSDKSAPAEEGESDAMKNENDFRRRQFEASTLQLIHHYHLAGFEDKARSMAAALDASRV